MKTRRYLSFLANALLPAFLAGAVLFFASGVSAAPDHAELHPAPFAELPFKSGERLVYEISWSRLIQAGTAVMEVREETGFEGKRAYRLISRANSGELLSRFYRVSDTIESHIAVDEKTGTLYPLSFHLDQHHGKRTKTRDMTFDREHGTVLVLADGIKETYPVPDQVQDALSSLYYVRTRNDFVVGKPMIVHVHQDAKTWAVEVQTLGRERLETAVGDFNTIKVRTYPRYEGVFQNTGEITIWLTDDDRKIPVLMKSTITIGSIVASLIELHYGEEKHDVTQRSQAPRKPH
jgi:hypothetical protein